MQTAWHRTRLLFPGILLVAASLGCNRTPVDDSHADSVVLLVDVKTHEVFVRENVSQLPAKHPRTGDRTLVSGMYCRRCQKWYPVPPVEELIRNPQARQCPKTGSPLTGEGPWPEQTD